MNRHPVHLSVSGRRQPGRRHLALGTFAAVGLAGFVLSACSSTPSHPTAAAGTKGTASSAPTTTTAAPAPTCPLTGGAISGAGPVPARPALAVKIDNYPDARPQSGLDHADMVFEEPVEGGI